MSEPARTLSPYMTAEEVAERDEVPLVHGRIYGDGPPPRCPVPGCDVHHRDGPRACVSIAPTVRARALRERERRRGNGG